MIASIALGVALGLLPMRIGIARLVTARTAMTAAAMVADVAVGAVSAAGGAAIDGDATAVTAVIATLGARAFTTWSGPAATRGLAVVVGGTAVLWPPGVVVLVAVAWMLITWTGTTWAVMVSVVAFACACIAGAAIGGDPLWGIEPDDLLAWFGLGSAAALLPGPVTELIDHG